VRETSHTTTSLTATFVRLKQKRSYNTATIFLRWTQAHLRSALIYVIYIHIHTHRLWNITPYNLVEIRQRFGKVTLSIFTNTVERSSIFEKGKCSETELHINVFENIGKARKGASVIFNIFAAYAITLEK